LIGSYYGGVKWKVDHLGFVEITGTQTVLAVAETQSNWDRPDLVSMGLSAKFQTLMQNQRNEQ